ncbi:TetR/AcrR family transcriptional regulator [Jiulongibacter sediminis]|uniref:TetR family transcriptional regulator n=1 Tax=Jiulongibacter sediminis TaxID=1605367 RepID=A0A0P7CAM2_9BACT|nr:TetR/AcrR family transcriptional regulator [Jiulongibacter sediminis]KPM49729.1 TetR family transcriptional regulator [Jiulongibacter sediminis]TBX26766.1 TetR family transcriptional regulator [Jiulongibacter sediminis]
MQKTKDKIILASLKLFNEHGLANVRLQQIADHIGISVGNLAYHFKTKEQIVLTVYEEMFSKYEHILQNYLKNPHLLDFDLQVSQFFEFFNDYRFYIADLFTNEHPFPEVQEKWQVLINKLCIQIRKRLDFHVKKGDLIAAEPKVYDNLSQTLLMQILFWIPQQEIMKKVVTASRYKETLWNNIQPYLTTQGKGEFSKISFPEIYD